MSKLLQICNTGRITGGTVACGWTVMKSLPGWQHEIVFLNSITSETIEAFSECSVKRWRRVNAELVRSADADIVLMHDMRAVRVKGSLPVTTIHYLHSRFSPAAADLTLYCSRWLAQLYEGKPDDVLRQAVPRPEPFPPDGPSRHVREHPVIGRICTPLPYKWPDDVAEFYAPLAQRFPQIRWEFVGTPDRLQPKLQEACCHKAVFLPASWEMRSRLWHWDAMLYHHPTLTESFGRTVAEAMRAGCIPIVDARGGFCEQVVEGCGFLCGNEGEFAEAVERILPAESRREMSRACRAHADTCFSLRRFGKELTRRFQQAAVIAPCSFRTKNSEPQTRQP